MEELIESLKDAFRLNTDDEELNKAFEEYLKDGISKIKSNPSPFIKKDDESIKRAVERVARNVIDSDIESKKRILLYDSDFKTIMEISTQVFEEAKKTLKTGVTSNLNTIEMEEQLKELLTNVKDYNKNKAKELVSESLLDLYFIRTRDINNLSFRLAASTNNNNSKFN